MAPLAPPLPLPLVKMSIKVLGHPMELVSNQYIVAYGKMKLNQVLNSSLDLIVSVLNLSFDKLARFASSKMTQECCQTARQTKEK